MVQDDTLAFMELIQDTYSYHFRDFAVWLKGREFSLGAVRDYFIYLNQDSGFAPGTIRIKRQAVKKRVKQYAYEMLDFEGRAKIKGDTSGTGISPRHYRRPAAADRGHLSPSYGTRAAVYRK